jgi:cytochrome P450
MDIAPECADHLLAGIDTISDSSMFLIWALSLPRNGCFKRSCGRSCPWLRLTSEECLCLERCHQLPYLNAVIKETLRFYAPLPTFEPRSSPVHTVIDGYHVPVGTKVGMSPYCLHRDPTIFPDPLKFDSGRWLTEKGTPRPENALQNRWFWAFSSGCRMCIGMHLANAEMTTLVAAIFARYPTSARYPDTSPGITSRFETFFDETMSKMQEHECWIDFEKIRQ